MAKVAAIFDLDRTLIGGASGPRISEALRDVELLPDRHLPGQGLAFAWYDLVGETRPSMLLTRQFVRAASGWPATTVREAGRRAAGLLVDQVQPFARSVLAEHRERGHRLVLATTTPEPLVAALAERLGFDDVVATHYEAADGYLTGRIAGEFVWGRGKQRAVAAWAAEVGVDLGASYAYSDSYFDRPLLRAVGHPVAVNPDPRLAVIAAVARWPVVWFDVPPGVPKIGGLAELQRLLRPFARPELFPYVRFDIGGLEHIPETGPAIVAGNHRSYFDPLAVGYTLARTGRSVRFLGKREVFDAPVVGQLARALGGIRVERGSGSGEPLREAAQALQAGELVAIMPQGTIPRGRAFFEPELRGRWGAVRLARMTDAPIIPLGLWGTEKVWPRNARVPNLWNVTSPPGVRVRVGPPVPLPGGDLDTDTKALMSAIVDLLPPIARVGREPTPAELARTLPPGYHGDPDVERDRRPGED